MSRQAGKLSSRNNGSSGSSNSSSNVVVTPGNSNKVVTSSIVRATKAALILNLNGADNGPSNGRATAS